MIFLSALFALLFGLFSICCSSEVCLPSWISFPMQNSISASQSPYTRLQDCLAYCEYNSTTQCVGVDFDNTTDPPCWVHTNIEDFTNPDYVYPSSSSTQYRLNQTCNTFNTSDCSLSWNRTEEMASLGNGLKYNYSTEFDCFTFCQYNHQCIGITYDSKSSQPCSIHIDMYDVMPENLASSPGATFYQLFNRTCSSQPAAEKSVGRCSGQVFPDTNWCEDGKVIHITKAFYRPHPLCCAGGYPSNVSPPDNQRLPAWSIQLLDMEYYLQINSSCEGKNNCSFTAKSKTENYISNTFCPNQKQTVNFVVISYTCLGSEDPTATQKTTTTLPINSNLPTMPTTISSAINVNSATTVSSATNVSSATTISSATNISSATTVSSATNVSSATTVSSAPLPTIPSFSQMLSKSTDTTQPKMTSDSNMYQTALVLGAIGTAFGSLALIAIVVIVLYCLWLQRRNDNNYRIKSNQQTTGNNNNYATMHVINPFYSEDHSGVEQMRTESEISCPSNGTNKQNWQC